jgi:hypothetical protein
VKSYVQRLCFPPLAAEIQSEFVTLDIGWEEARVTECGTRVVAVKVPGPGKETASRPEMDWKSRGTAGKM